MSKGREGTQTTTSWDKPYTSCFNKITPKDTHTHAHAHTHTHTHTAVPSLGSHERLQLLAKLLFDQFKFRPQIFTLLLLQQTLPAHQEWGRESREGREGERGGEGGRGRGGREKGGGGEGGREGRGDEREC